jgi:1,2-diacylglycerol 3-alpha-glucosyltransferase
MTRRLTLITEIISPYRIPLFNALAQTGKVDLHVIFLAETDPVLRQWLVYREEIRFSYQVLPSWRSHIGGYNALINTGITGALRAARPDVILCGGYNYLAFWQALVWARIHAAPFFLWSESNVQDQRPGYAWVELLKSAFLRRCSGFVVPGRSAAEYLRVHKIKDDFIFTAVNAVDNDFFSASAASARTQAARWRTELGLPQRYFLFVGRLVREKGVFELLSAYAKLDSSLRDQVGLVFAGDGVSRPTLEQEAASVARGMVRFLGFAQREHLAVYYALAEMLILPTYSDPWGLVVNEAMACGLPVIVSRAAGCAEDLVTENWNGLLVEPGAVMPLSSAMDTLARNADLSGSMGTNSRKRISEYSPELWSRGIVQMMEAAGGSQ